MTTDIAPPKDYDAGSLHRFFNFSSQKLYENRDAKQSKVSLFFNFLALNVASFVLIAFIIWSFTRTQTFDDITLPAVSLTDVIFASLFTTIVVLSLLRIKFRKFRYYRGYGMSIFANSTLRLLYQVVRFVLFPLHIIFLFYDRSEWRFEFGELLNADLLGTIFWLALIIMALVQYRFCWKK